MGRGDERGNGLRRSNWNVLWSGWNEGRDPSAGFDTRGYLAAHPDVAAANINPLDHYLMFGIYEGRQPVNDGAWL